MKHLAILTLHFSLLTLHSSAAVPMRWTVETTRAQPATFEAYQGETLAFEAALQSAGKPLELSGIAALYWQTNGMGSAYWETTAAVNSNRLSAVWTPEMDVGAKVYNCFIGIPGTVYHAAFQLRLRPSPGATPNALPLPVPVIDFAKVEVKNAPWASAASVHAVSATADNARITANDALDKANAAQEEVAAVSADIDSKLDRSDVVAPSADSRFGQAADAKVVRAELDSILSLADQAARDAGTALNDIGDTKADLTNVKITAQDALLAAEAAQEEVGDVRRVMAGEDFRITITNYDSKIHSPELSMEARYSDGTTQRWDTVWTETNGLKRTKLETLAEVRSNHYDKAESDARYKAWGQNDGYTGDAAPEGFAQYSGPGGLIIGADSGWKNYVSAGGGSYWIWRGNGNVTTSQATGTLDILDSDGNAALSLVKGDKTLESAAAASIAKSADGAKDIVTIVYNVKAEEAPVLEFSAELKPALWLKQTDDGFPGSVEWTSEGNVKWTAVVTLPANGQGFFRATYWKGKENYIRSNKSMALDGGIIIDGVKFSLKVVEINGVKVLGVE